MIKISSIHNRLIVSALFIALFFFSVTAYILGRLYQNTAEQHMHEQLLNLSYAIIAAAKESDKGEMQLPEFMADPRLNRLDSGVQAAVYSQDNNYQWYSRSTDKKNRPDHNSPFPESGEPLYRQINNNRSQLLLTISWEDFEGVETRYLISIVISRQQLDERVNHFYLQLFSWLTLTAILLIIFQTMILHWGLFPLRKVTKELEKIQQGDKIELSDDYPAELQLLTRQINHLLSHTKKQLKRYRNSLGDLTHSLKTPLAIMQGELIARHDSSALSSQVHKINELISYQLQKASIAGKSPLIKLIAIEPLINEILSALDKVYLPKKINLSKTIDASILLYGEEGDLMELFGNLLDNAYKYCKKELSIKVNMEDDKKAHIEISNDGNIISESLLKTLIERGVRADEKLPGHGIGLNIVSEIIKLYEAEIQFFSRPSGGLTIIISMDAKRIH